MRYLLLPAALLVTASPSALAQQALEKVRFEWVSGYLASGTLADTDFILDASGFGGQVVRRSEGFLDVDPALAHGLRGTYRVTERISVAGSYMRSRGRLRVQFPALASVDGNFDLEGLILAGFDFVFGGGGFASGSRPESAMSDAITDVYLGSLEFEFPQLNGRAYPFVTLGAGIFKQSSTGNLFHLEFEGPVPEVVRASQNVGRDFLGQSGLSVLAINDTDPVVSIGGGVRASLSERWGLEAEFLDLVRLGSDLTYIDASSTPAPDPNLGQVYSTTFRGRTGLVHNFAITLGLNYALWPWATPR